ncbi:hypothetical protein BJX76DRAFT_335525, partial [Aspergillus varians]
KLMTCLVCLHERVSMPLIFCRITFCATVRDDMNLRPALLDCSSSKRRRGVCALKERPYLQFKLWFRAEDPACGSCVFLISMLGAGLVQYRAWLEYFHGHHSVA